MKSCNYAELDDEERLYILNIAEMDEVSERMVNDYMI